MARTMNMNVKQEVEASNAGRGGTFKKNALIYSPLPGGRNPTGKAANKLYFSVFVPAKWSLYQTDDAVIQAGSISEDLATFYWKLLGHYVQVQLPDGNKRQVFMLCPKEQNKYQTEILKEKPLFRDCRCRICEEQTAWWAKFEAEWNSTMGPNGQPLGDRWGYQKEAFNKIVKEHETLGFIKDQAWACNAQTRFIFQVFDINKFEGSRKMDEGEASPHYQAYFAPKSIFDGLNSLYENGLAFYDIGNPSTILVNKDCTKGARYAEYSVQNLGPFAVPADWRAYLENDASAVDIVAGRPGEDDATVIVLSYEDMRTYTGMTGEPGTMSTFDRAPQQQYYQGGAPPPAVPAPPAPRAFGGVQPIAPVAPPAPVAYGAVAPVAPVPMAMAPIAPVAPPSAPVPIAPPVAAAAVAPPMPPSAPVPVASAPIPAPPAPVMPPPAAAAPSRRREGTNW